MLRPKSPEVLVPLIVAVDHPVLRRTLELQLPRLGVTPAIVGPSYAVFRVPPQQVDEGVVVLDTNDDIARLVQIVNDLYRSPLHLNGASGTVCVVSNSTFETNPSLGWWLVDGHAAVFSVRSREELSAEEIARVIRWASRSGSEEDEGPSGTNRPLSFETLFDSIRSDPANADSWMAAYDRVMSQDGIHHARYAIGAAFCRQAAAIHPEDATLWVKMAQALHYCGRDEEAATAARTAIEIRPDLPRAHLLLGEALHRLGQKEEAVAEMQKAVDLSGDDPSIRQWVEAYLPTEGA